MIKKNHSEKFYFLDSETLKKHHAFLYSHNRGASHSIEKPWAAPLPDSFWGTSFHLRPRDPYKWWRPYFFFGCFPSDLTNEKQDKSFRDLVLSKKNLSPQLNDQTKRWQRKNASIPCGNLFLQMPGVSGPLQRRFASRRSVETCARSWHRVCLLHETT